jgi:peptide deformylase
MAILDILRMGHPVLRTEAALYPAANIGSKAFLSLVKDMRETLHASGGIGLAGPQVNIPYQVAVIEILDSGSRYGDIPTLPFAVYINPVLTIIDPTTAGYWEGCLSIPGMMGYVERPQHIRVDYMDEHGAAQTMTLKGFLATVFQHEFDHLWGHLYVDRLKDPSLFAFEAEYRQFHQGNLAELAD